MKRSPLVATLLLCSFALQLVLAGGGATCVMPGGAAHVETSTEGAEMAAMDMSGMDMSGMDMTDMSAGESASTPAHGHTPDGTPCDQQTTPAACQVMAPCAGGFVGAARSATEAVAGVPARVEVANVTMPPSRTVPPDLPPPRA